MRDKLNRFMQGRYGADSFAKCTMGIALVSIILSVFMPYGSVLRKVMDFIGIAAILYSYYRMFSRNISARYQENQKYLQKTAGIRKWFGKQKYLLQQRKIYHIYACPSCHQKIRIPRGKGKIEIDCPKCHTKFVKKS